MLTEDDLLIEMTEKPGYVSENNGDVTVVLDTNLDEELITEGFVRELISKIQTMRKEADFNVTDHIRISYQGTEKIERIFREQSEEIMGDTLGDEVVSGESGYVKDWDINGEKCRIGVEVV